MEPMWIHQKRPKKASIELNPSSATLIEHEDIMGVIGSLPKPFALHKHILYWASTLGVGYGQSYPECWTPRPWQITKQQKAGMIASNEATEIRLLVSSRGLRYYRQGPGQTKSTERNRNFVANCRDPKPPRLNASAAANCQA